MRKIGLARALSKLGYCSRSQAVELIVAGRVHLNGVVRRDPESPVHDLEKARIEVDGNAVIPCGKVYLVMNKPRGVITSAADEEGRKTVYALLEERSFWIAPIGRLDKASEGLLLFSNDTAWSDRVLSPETHLDKIYHVQVGAVVDESFTQKVTKGVRTADGDFLQVKAARILRGGERNTWIEIVLDEGKNRQIRRVFEHFAIEVLRLVRIAIGPLVLGKLAKGEVRPLSSDEKSALDQAMARHKTELTKRQEKSARRSRSPKRQRSSS